jgi:aminoglycoside phosphotransferase (APT) family kinase protein
MTFNAAALDWLARSIEADPQDLTLTPLNGSTTSSVFLIEASPRSNSQRFVLRVLDNPNWLTAEPDLAQHEAAALNTAQRAGLNAPGLVAYSSTDVGFGVPVVLMTFVEGKVDLQPTDFQNWITALADELASIHRHTAIDFGWQYQSWVDQTTFATVPWTTIPEIWERAIDLWRGPRLFAPNVFIHRDYHPMNVLWRNNKISGVVDWINACQGPAGVDVAHCRTNLALMFGVSEADHFLEAYCKINPSFEYTPYWDLDSLFDMCIPQPTFYSPWQDFGLDLLSTETLQHRIDAYLKSVMARVKS